jgi:hypothetical protein
MIKKICLSVDDEEDIMLQSGIDRLQDFGWVTRINETTLQINKEFFEIYNESIKDCNKDPQTMELNHKIMSHPVMTDQHDFMDTIGGDAELFSGASMVGHRMLTIIGELDNPSPNLFYAVVQILLKLSGGRIYYER